MLSSCRVLYFVKQKSAYEMRISDCSPDGYSSELTALVGADNGVHRDLDVPPYIERRRSGRRLRRFTRRTAALAATATLGLTAGIQREREVRDNRKGRHSECARYRPTDADAAVAVVPAYVEVRRDEAHEAG